MLLTMESEGQAATQASPHLAVLEADPAKYREIAAPLEARGYRVERYGATAELALALRSRRPVLLVLGAASSGAATAELDAVRAAAREMGIPVLDVVESGTDPDEVLQKHRDADGWIFRSSLQAELEVRVRLLLRRQERLGTPPAPGLPKDSRFFPLIVHDLRTPLNVIGLSLRMIDQALPRGNSELEEDLRFVEENFKQIERMLSQLSDYCRLFEPEFGVSATEFSPQRLLTEVVEGRAQKAGPKAGAVQVEVEPSCPEGVELDPIRAKLAIQYALGNAISASNGAGVRVRLRGAADRCITEFGVDLPVPPSVKSTELRPHLFERLCGTAAERRGMDLAIVARVSEMFGGTARLEVLGDRGSSILLDWPVRLAGT